MQFVARENSCVSTDCGADFNSRAAFMIHKNLNHLLLDEAYCPICKRKYTKSFYLLHMKKHENFEVYVTCEVCGEKFNVHWFRHKKKNTERPLASRAGLINHISRKIRGLEARTNVQASALNFSLCLSDLENSSKCV